MPKKDELDDIDFEIAFYEGVVEKNGDFLEALMALGDIYTKKGLYAKGLEIDKKLVKLRPEDPYVLYNLACSYSLVNDIDHAFQVVKMAVEAGYDDFDHLENDHDLDNLKHDQRFTHYLSQVKVRGQSNETE